MLETAVFSGTGYAFRVGRRQRYRRQKTPRSYCSACVEVGVMVIVAAG